jgi:hypothetical protein
MKLIVIALTLLASACTPRSYPIAGADPADPGVPVPPVRYQSTLGAYAPQRPVTPKPWREQNDSVAPKEKKP